MGLVSFRPGLGAREMVRLADEAMYRSKNTGGNRVSAHAADVEEGAV